MKNKKLTNLLKGLLATSALMSVLVACGSKNNDNNQQINAFNASCVNCDGISGYPFFSAQTSAYYYRAGGGYYGYNNSPTMQITWSFSGQNISGQALGQNNNNYYSSPAMNYVGRVSAAGTVNVAQAINFGFCPQIPAGQYTLQTQTVGQWNQGQISGLKFIITGAVSMTAYLSQAQAYENNYQYSSTSRITNGSIIIEQVNGYYCQGAQLQLY